MGGEMGALPTINVQPNRAPQNLKCLSRTLARRFTERRMAASLSERPGGMSRCVCKRYN
jgi:hypothetical protein